MPYGSLVSSCRARPGAPPLVPPSAPSGLSATVLGSTRVDLAWTDTSSNETGFGVERSLDGATWVQIGTAAANAVGYSDTTAAPQTPYQYRVRALGTAGNSAYAGPVSATTWSPLRDGLVAYVLFDDALGTDLTGRGNDLTPHNGPTVVGGETRLTAASSQYYDRPSTADLTISGTDATILALVRLASKPGEGSICAKFGGSDGNSEWNLEYAGNDRFGFTVRDVGANATAQGIASPVIGRQYLVAGRTRISDKRVSISIDGVEESFTNYVGAGPAATSQTIEVGRFLGGQYVDAALKGWAIYHRRLTDAELVQMWNGGSPLLWPDF